jgi:uncharacterized membrane protein YphA (DoxX/SURF4 family)
MGRLSPRNPAGIYKNNSVKTNHKLIKMKIKNSINWILTGLVGFIFIRSGLMKMASFELIDLIDPVDNQRTIILACIEICAAVLFIIPRTSILGTLLLVAYIGGAIATKLEREEPLISTLLVSTFVWIAAVARNPELSQRILGKIEIQER